MIRSCIRTLGRLLLTMAALLPLASCHSIYDGEGDCSVTYRVDFRYTLNMKNADALPAEVTRVTLYVFDPAGRLVTVRSEAVAPTDGEHYSMRLDVQPGRYDLLAWCEGRSPIEGATSFVVRNADAPAAMSDLSCALPLGSDAAGPCVERDIHRLYHGMAANVEFPDTYGTVHVGPVSLTKDTNLIRVLLQQIGGKRIERSDFEFHIEAANNELDYRNRVTSTVPFRYLPWSKQNTSAVFDETSRPDYAKRAAAATRTEPNGLLAEFTVGRLIDGTRPELVVRRTTDDREIIRINLIRYLLLVKGEYNRPMDNQEYLDRQDDYTMMFFVDSDHDWYTAGGLFVNSWMVVPPQDTEM